MTGEDVSLDEKRVYGERREATAVYAATGLGLARVAVSGDRAGRIELVRRGTMRDVAGADGRLLVATPEDVLVGTAEGFEPTGFGPAVAVGVGADLLVAADPDGRIARLVGDDWQDVGTVDGPRRFDGAFLATAGGVARVDSDGLDRLGLDGVRDVAAAGPYAATDGGLYRLDDGEWTTARDGAAELVAADAERAHVVAGDALYEREGDAWVRRDLPVAGRVADVAYGEATYAATADGTFLVDAPPDATPDGGGGWRHRALGLPDVASVAVPSPAPPSGT